jgi:iron(III) transport system substrate-binding protein
MLQCSMRPDKFNLTVTGAIVLGGTQMSIIRTSTYSMLNLSRRTLIKGAGAAAVGAAFSGSLMDRASAQSSDKLMWFSGSSVDSVDAWAKMFQEKYGNEVEYFRAGGVKLAQRFEQEVKAGQANCGVLDIALPGLMTKWGNDNLLMNYVSPEAKHYPEDAQVSGLWVPIKALACCIAYNSNVIKAEEAPRTWEDLLDPKWKDKMIMSDAFSSGATLHWYGAIRSTYGKSYMENLAKQNVLIRAGSGETVDGMVSGERPIAASVLQYYVFGEIGKGAKLQMVFPEEGVPVGYEVIGIPQNAPDPDLAKKFVDFSLGKEAQTFWQQKFYTPSLRDDVEPLSREYGRRPLSEIKRLSSSAADMDRLFAQQTELLDEWGTLFK